MNRYHNERLGKLVSWLTMKTIKLVVLIVVVAVVSGVVFDVYKDQISIEIWTAFEVEYDNEKERYEDKYGIIDNELIDFDVVRTEPQEI